MRRLRLQGTGEYLWQVPEKLEPGYWLQYAQVKLTVPATCARGEYETPSACMPVSDGKYVNISGKGIRGRAISA